MRLDNYLVEARGATLKQIEKKREWYWTGLREDQQEWFRANWSKIAKQCAPAIRELRAASPRNRALLSRGMKELDLYVDAQVMNRRKDRRPMTSDLELHFMFDEGLERKFGWKPRSQGVYMIPTTGSTAPYGAKWITLPIGKYSYIWSPNTADSISYMSGYSAAKTLTLDYQDDLQEQIPWFKEAHKKKYGGEELELHDNKITTTHLENYFFGGHDKRKVWPEWFIDMMDNYVATSIDKMEYKDDGMKQLLQQERYEVIFNVNKYYAINMAYKEVIQDMIYGMKG